MYELECINLSECLNLYAEDLCMNLNVLIYLNV
jgi:hypothetical protein